MAWFIRLIPFCIDRPQTFMKRASLAFFCYCCFRSQEADVNPSSTPAMATSVSEIAEGYVKLALAIGQHDPDYVDAYYGPQEWKKPGKEAARYDRA